eukprot:m51a1_g468 putative major vault protein (697) ;mRNA; r:181916-185425
MSQPQQQQLQPPRVCLIKLPPHHYLHVLDRNTMVTRLAVGPRTLRCCEHEQVVQGPSRMLVVPPRHYCLVRNPAVRDGASGAVRVDADGQTVLRHGDVEGEVTPFQVVPANEALRLRALRDFEDTCQAGKGKLARRAGDEWLFLGPATYIPRVEVEVVEQRKACIILPNTALRLRASHEFVDGSGRRRIAGEEWIVSDEGAYLPSVDEEVVSTVAAVVLTPRRALHLRAAVTFEDRFGRRHRKGEEWLVRHTDCESFIPDVREEVVADVDVTALSSRQFCVVRNAADEAGVPQLGLRRLIRGPATFFLLPGEAIESIRDVYVLGDNQALRVRCMERFADTEVVRGRARAVERVPGSVWLVRGPCEYVPPLEVAVVEAVSAIVGVEALQLFVFERSTISSSAQDSSSWDARSSSFGSESDTTTPASCGNSKLLRWVALSQRDVENNAQRLVDMCKKAADQGACLAVTTEMALSGYSFWSRSEVDQAAQDLDSSIVLENFKSVARILNMDILLGLPIADRSMGLYYNSAVLVLSTGRLGGHCAKMNHLLESSYNAQSFQAPEPLETSHGFRIYTCMGDEKDIVLKCYGDLAMKLTVDIVVTIGDTTVLRDSDSNSYEFTRLHSCSNDNSGSVTLGSKFVVVNRPYARVALLHGVDFLVPELLKLSGSVRAHSAMLHVVVANNRGKQGIYRAGAFATRR